MNPLAISSCESDYHKRAGRSCVDSLVSTTPLISGDVKRMSAAPWAKKTIVD
jgi:hypothetical protein